MTLGVHWSPFFLFLSLAAWSLRLRWLSKSFFHRCSFFSPKKDFWVTGIYRIVIYDVISQKERPDLVLRLGYYQSNDRTFLSKIDLREKKQEIIIIYNNNRWMTWHTLETSVAQCTSSLKQLRKQQQKTDHYQCCRSHAHVNLNNSFLTIFFLSRHLVVFVLASSRLRS